MPGKLPRSVLRGAVRGFEYRSDLHSWPKRLWRRVRKFFTRLLDRI
jgi:hypothetical protein